MPSLTRWVRRYLANCAILHRTGKFPVYLLSFMVMVTLFSYWDTGEFPGAAVLREDIMEYRAQRRNAHQLSPEPVRLVQDVAQNVAPRVQLSPNAEGLGNPGLSGSLQQSAQSQNSQQLREQFQNLAAQSDSIVYTDTEHIQNAASNSEAGILDTGPVQDVAPHSEGDVNLDTVHIHVEMGHQPAGVLGDFRKKLEVSNLTRDIGVPVNALDHIDMSNKTINVLGQVGIDTPQLMELQPDNLVGNVEPPLEEEIIVEEFQFADSEAEMDLGSLESEQGVAAADGAQLLGDPDQGSQSNFPADPMGPEAVKSQSQAPPGGVVDPDDWSNILSPVNDIPEVIKTDVDPKSFSRLVTNDMLSTFKLNLPPLLPNYKNPCWIEDYPSGFNYDKSFYNECHFTPKTHVAKHAAQYDKLTLMYKNKTAHHENFRVRCFPYFFLLGMGKSGTTDLFESLKRFVPDLAYTFLKEPHFWEWKRCQEKSLCRDDSGINPRNPSLSDYLDPFDGAAEEIYRNVVVKDGQKYHPQIIGDFTPSTLAFHPCWQTEPGNEGLVEPQYMNAHVVKSIYPKAKFLLIMRDPVERIFSNYRMKDRLTNDPAGLNAETFHRDMLNATKTLYDCMKIHSPRACAFSIMNFNFATHVTNSMYGVFLLDWLKLFPRDQFLFIRMEDYMQGRLPHVKRILHFLDMAPLTPAQEEEITNKQVSNQAGKADMRDDTRQLLQDFFRPWNRLLVKLLNDESYTWGY